ncbi:MAG: acyl-CoA dehydrogenase family protein [Chloroflexota bacterium]|nr:acyl-CoA dehydrogenase family protein [Chloroflexota bacterium]
MDFSFSAEEKAFREEVRDFIKKEVPSDFRGADMDAQYDEEGIESVRIVAHEMRRKLADKGWLAMYFPEEYGGQGASFMKEVVLAEELAYYRVPGRDMYGVTIVGPCILRFGTEEQKKKYLTEVTRGEVVWGVGMSEPNAGSDLASLKTKATLDGGHFVVNGQKIWNSGAHVADRYILYVRTDPDAHRHKGISVLLIDLHETKGIDFRTIEHMTGLFAFNEVFLDDVRVPQENLLGDLNGGWAIALTSLDFERPFALIGIAAARRTLDDLIGYARATDQINDPVTRNKLSEMAIEIEVGRALGYNIAWKRSLGHKLPAEGAMIKMCSIDLDYRLAKVGMQMLGFYGQLDEDSKWAPLRGEIKYLYLRSIGLLTAGGTAEIMKNTVAGVGLGMPRG